MKNFGFIDSLTTSLVGFAIVFVVLIVLMYAIRWMRAIMESVEAKVAGGGAGAVPAAVVSAPASNMIPAKGSLGEIKLHDVDDKTAALIMAIVADKLEAPLNELRFISICEKK